MHLVNRSNSEPFPSLNVYIINLCLAHTDGGAHEFDIIRFKGDEKTKQRSELLVEDPRQVKVKSVFWLLFRRVGTIDERRLQPEGDYEQR